jgi:hypothetical protein
LPVILHAESCDIEADQIALIPWAAKETDHGTVFWRWPNAPDWHHGFEVTLAGSDRLRAPKSVGAGTYPPLELNDLRLVHEGEFMGSFACA